MPSDIYPERVVRVLIARVQCTLHQYINEPCALLHRNYLLTWQLMHYEPGFRLA